MVYNALAYTLKYERNNLASYYFNTFYNSVWRFFSLGNTVLIRYLILYAIHVQCFCFKLSVF